MRVFTRLMVAVTALLISLSLAHAAGTTTVLISGPGPGKAVPISSRNLNTSNLYPSVLAFLSSGAVLTYQVEVTGDDTSAPGYSASQGNWMPLDATAVGMSVSTPFSITANVLAVRINVTSFTSGTLTEQVVQ